MFSAGCTLHKTKDHFIINGSPPLYSHVPVSRKSESLVRVLSHFPAVALLVLNGDEMCKVHGKCTWTGDGSVCQVYQKSQSLFLALHNLLWDVDKRSAGIQASSSFFWSWGSHTLDLEQLTSMWALVKSLAGWVMFVDSAITTQRYFSCPIETLPDWCGVFLSVLSTLSSLTLLKTRIKC